MKITDLKEFRFDIGNTTDEDGGFVADVVATNKGILEGDELDVIATNDGIEIGGVLDGKYDDVDIIDAHDLCNAIDDAILNCSTLTSEEKNELGTYLGSDADIKLWWEENYG